MGILRIHFSAEDLSLTRVAASPDPLWEVVLSLHRLQTAKRHPSRSEYAGWHERVREGIRRSGLGGVIGGQLMPIAPLSSYFPDFLTPGHTTDLREGVERVMRTPRTRIRAEVTRLTEARGAGPWLGDLAGGRAAPMIGLGHALRHYHEVAVAPYWSEICASVAEERVLRGARMLDGGIGQVLCGLGPETSWEPPVLSIRYPQDRDLHLGDRGIELIPSYFCWHAPIALADPDLPPILVYPAVRRRSEVLRTATDRALGPLMGRTRLRVLRAVASSATTGELAHRAGISAGTATHHTSVLREAGLIVSHRAGNLMIHHLTPLGESLLNRKG